MELKRCYVCKDEKSINDFYDDKTRSGAIRKASRCKLCSNNRKRKRDRVLQRSYDRSRLLRTKYGISIEQFHQMIKDQESKCAICGLYLELVGKSFKNRMDLDHDHATGKVRGLLCGHCNLGLGNFKDRPDLLVNAAEYLKKAA